MMEKRIISEIVKDFESISKEAWIEKISSDLKGKPIEDLYVSIDEELVMEPFVHSEDIVSNHALPKSKNGWYSGVGLNYEDPDTLNQHILKNLKNGAEAIRIKISTAFAPEQVYKDVIPQFIYSDLDFSGCENEIPKWISHLGKLADLNEIHFSLNLNEDAYFQNLSLVKELNAHPICIEEAFDLGVIRSLSAVAEKIISLLEKGVNPNQISVKMNAEHHLIKTITKIRSLKIIWSNLLDHFKLNQIPIFIKTMSDKTLQRMEDNDQLIAAGNLAVGSIMGGSDLIYLIDDTSKSEEQSRLGLNVQHLLKLEAHLDEVNDPLAGSYVIENLSQNIAKRVWNAL